tara:strand:+ start:657 stop:944 length:288 start_codon:yes stop_codon:yes gene_type:complete
MKNVKIKQGARIGYGIAVEGDEFDAFGNPTKNSHPMILEAHLNKGLRHVKHLAKQLANRKSEHGVPHFGRVVVVELRAVEEIEPTQAKDDDDLDF